MSTSIQRSSSKPTKPPNQTTPARSSSSSLSSHLAMIELKQRILTSLSKLSDRDTHHIAVEDLEKIIQTLSNDGVSMLLNCLFEATNDPKPAVKKEALRLLAALCTAHTDPAATHLTKIIAHIVKRLKDSDSGVRDACRDAIGSLSGLYLKGGGGGGDGVAMLFVKPLFEVMSDSTKTTQSGAAMCMAKMVECASDPPLPAFQKLCPRVCKYLNSPNFMAKASLLPVVTSLSQVGAITQQNLELFLQSIQGCLGSSDWATRKAAADTLIALASNSSNITADGASSVYDVLEACRFDKIKPVRESITEALQLWKKIAGKGDGSSDENKASSSDAEACESADVSDKKDPPNLGARESESLAKDSSSGSSPTDSIQKGKGNNILDKAVGILKKKAPALTDKELNPEFFQKLETKGSGDFPVEVAVPRRYLNSSNSQNEEEPVTNDSDPKGTAYRSGETLSERDIDAADFSKNPSRPEGLINNKLNWLAIQRQLMQLERQQAHLMNMLQDFMGGSHDSMVTLENRVRGLERVVEDMARDMSISGSRRGSNATPGFEVSANRSLSKYNGFPEYSSGKFGRVNDGRFPFGERFSAFDSISSGTWGRGPWRSDAPDAWDVQGYGKNGLTGSRRTKSENEGDQVGNRRGWEKGAGPVRFGEGPSARSVWQASKDEATLEAIRVAGEDNVAARNARVATPEMTPEALGDDGTVQERDPVWTSWSNVMDALHVGDMDSAFAEVLSIGDDSLLVKLMERTGPVIDQLSSEIATEVLHAVSQLLLEQSLFDICFYWVHQLAEIVVENGPDVLRIPMEVKREILLNLNDASSSIDLPEDWDSTAPDQLLLQLASSWQIDLQNLEK